MIVRRADRDDIPIVRDLRLEAMTDAPDAFASTYDREFARTDADWERWLSPGVTFLVEEAHRPVGLVAGKHDGADPAVVHLMAMWVHPSARGTGAGDALVKAVVEWAREVGAEKVRLHVVIENMAARRLYERHGFVPGGRGDELLCDGRIEMRMERAVERRVPEGD